MNAVIQSREIMLSAIKGGGPVVSGNYDASMFVTLLNST